MSARTDVPVTLVPARSGRGRTVIVALLAVAAVSLGADRFDLSRLLPSVRNPFASRTVERSQAPLRKSLEDLSRYQAATAQLSVIIDSEKDARLLPSFLRGERTIFTAAGSVDATVDFSGIGDRAISVSEDRRSVTLTLPAPRLSDARIDPDQSRVVSRQRGLFDRVGSAFSDNPSDDHSLYSAAQNKMNAAAAHDTELVSRAETNTRRMLETMLRTLGYSTVTVGFTPNPS